MLPCDPRIHFALVCGAKSCPPIKLYAPANLEEGLGGAAEAFCQGDVDVDRAARSVAMSKIFKVRDPRPAGHVPRDTARMCGAGAQ